MIKYQNRTKPPTCLCTGRGMVAGVGSEYEKSLRDAGHQVFTPTLTGLGERSHLNSAAVNLSTHIADVVNLFRWEDLSDVILCGHSYGGNVISGVADRIPERIRTLLYLDAFVPEDGECLFDLHSSERAQQMRLQAQTGWDNSPFRAAHERAKAKGWKTHTVTCGHEVMLDLPGELTDMLLEFVTSAVP